MFLARVVTDPEMHNKYIKGGVVIVYHASLFDPLWRSEFKMIETEKGNGMTLVKVEATEPWQVDIENTLNAIHAAGRRATITNPCMVLNDKGQMIKKSGRYLDFDGLDPARRSVVESNRMVATPLEGSDVVFKSLGLAPKQRWRRNGE